MSTTACDSCTVRPRLPVSSALVGPAHALPLGVAVRHEGCPSEKELEQRKKIIDEEDAVADKQRAYLGHGGAEAVEADEQLALIVDLVRPSSLALLLASS